MQEKRPYNIEEETRNLESLLDWGSEHYKGLRVIDDAVDITDAFYRESRKKYQIPKLFRKTCSEVIIGGYGIKGFEGVPPVVSKYAAMELADGCKGLVLKDFNKEAQLFSILCIEGMQNTSLFEIYEGITLINRDGVEGFSQRAINRIVQRLNHHYGTFNPEVDSFFMFAGKKEEVRAKIELNKKWLSQILEDGSKAPYIMDEREAELLERVIGKEKIEALLSDFTPLNFYQNGPAYQTWAFSPMSQVFAYHKIAAYAKQKGIMPTIRVNDQYFELKENEIGKVLSGTYIREEIASRQPVQFIKSR